MISLIITVKNEKTSLPYWLESIRLQTKQPSEIIIVDGGSTDGTWIWLQSIASDQVRVFQKKGNIATGRNYAIEQASNEIIAVADAGCYYEPTWLAKLTEPLLKKQAEWTATAFGPWLLPTQPLLLFILAAATTPAPIEFFHPWLPSSRSVAFTKVVWRLVRGYPAWIPFSEDVIFDLTLKKKGVILQPINEVLVLWQPRTKVLAFMKQLYNYTRGDGHGKLWYTRQVIRFVVYGGSMLSVCLAFKTNIWWLLALATCACIYLFKFQRRFFIFAKLLPLNKKIIGMMMLPIIIGLGDMSKMVGWLIGILERWTGKIKYQPW